MIGLPEAAAAALSDPLFITLAVLLLGGLLTHLLFRRHPLSRATLRVIFLLVLTIVLLRAGVVPYEPQARTGVPFQDAVRATLKIAWWLWTAWFLVGLLRVFVVTEHRQRERKLVQDLLAGLIYLAAVFAIIAYVFDLPIQGLLATSGAIAIILGLALQSTLSDVFSGIVLNFSRPYRPGDWISIDGSTDGRVIEMNWRATHVLTGKSDLAIVPNSTIAKAKIVNTSSPSGIHGMSVTIQLDPKTSPSTGAEILHHAIQNTQPRSAVACSATATSNSSASSMLSSARCPPAR
jgi:small-conductance mechanosensitive channel